MLIGDALEGNLRGLLWGYGVFGGFRGPKIGVATFPGQTKET